MRTNRLVQVEDMVIQHKPSRTDIHSLPPHTYGAPWTGVVYKIDTRLGSKAAYLVWTPCAPPGYNEEYGIVVLNIHNAYSTYDVIKKTK